METHTCTLSSIDPVRHLKYNRTRFRILCFVDKAIRFVWLFVYSRVDYLDEKHAWIFTRVPTRHLGFFAYCQNINLSSKYMHTYEINFSIRRGKPLLLISSVIYEFGENTVDSCQCEFITRSDAFLPRKYFQYDKTCNPPPTLHTTLDG